jgi:ribonuclease HI
VLERELGEMVTVYTDGGCSPNPGVGGWGWITDDDQYYACGGLAHSSNNEMELMAICEAIKVWGRDIIILCDSNYARGVILNRTWELKANVALVLEIRRLMNDNNVVITPIAGKQNRAHILVDQGRTSVQTNTTPICYLP